MVVKSGSIPVQLRLAAVGSGVDLLGPSRSTGFSYRGGGGGEDSAIRGGGRGYAVMD